MSRASGFGDEIFNGFRNRFLRELHQKMLRAAEARILCAGSGHQWDAIKRDAVVRYRLNIHYRPSVKDRALTPDQSRS